MPKSLGEIGYEKWKSLLAPHASAGLSSWYGIPQRSRAGWEIVAQTIVDAYVALIADEIKTLTSKRED